jgi:hypothetical protein
MILPEELQGKLAPQIEQKNQSPHLLPASEMLDRARRRDAR